MTPRFLAATIILAVTASTATAEPLVRELPRGTSTIDRTLSDGQLNATGSWDGTRGGSADRTTTCISGSCSTNWVGTGPNGRAYSGDRDTTFGNGQSTTTARTTGPRGTRERTVQRRRY